VVLIYKNTEALGPVEKFTGLLGRVADFAKGESKQRALILDGRLSNFGGIKYEFEGL
jgi:hypothetical protein